MDKEKENEQEKQKPDKDVLIVTDNKTGERGVVTGMNSIGNPIKMPVRKEYSQSFLQFDKSGNALDNFFTNFVRQCKEPTRFGFTKTTTGALERLFAGSEEAKAEIEGESINPSNYINNKNKKKMEQNPNNENAAQQQENKHQYQPIDETKVNWADIQQKWGVTRDQLEQSGDLNKMLNYGKSNLITVHPAFGGEQLSFYLDYYPGYRDENTMKVMRHESLGIYIYAKPKSQREKDYNDRMREKAEALRCRRFESIVNERYDFFDREKEKGNFLAWFKKKENKI